LGRRTFILPLFKGELVGISLSSIAKQEATAPIKFGEHTLSVVHNPSAFTPEFEAIVRSHTEDNGSELLVQMLVKLIKTWDLIDADGDILGADRKGEIIPIEEAFLRKLPISILSAVSIGIGEEHQPVKNAAAPTRSGSFS
jgi:hypothetical protein